MKLIKNTLTTIAAVLLMTNFGIAQQNRSDSRSELQLGAKIGTNYSNVYDVEGEDFTADFKFGLVGGVFAEIPIGKYLGLHPELLFSQRGYMGSGSILGSAYEYSNTKNYIDVPLLVSIKPAGVITILVGPQFAFLLKEKYEFKNDLVNIDEEQVFENENIRKNTLCFVGGFDINLNQIVLGARVGWDLQNNNGDGTSTTPRYKNMWYQATLGYRISLQ